MATWVFDTNDPLTVKRWSKQLLVQFLQQCWMLRLASKQETAAIQIRDDLAKHAGDQVTFGLSKLLTGAGVLGNNTVTGNEETPITLADSLVIDELVHSTSQKGGISNQRVAWDRRMVARGRLADWYADRIDTALVNQACGNVVQTDVRYTGQQAALTPLPNAAASGVKRQIISGKAGTAHTDAAAIAAGDIFYLALIDTAVQYAKSVQNGIRPLKIDGRDVFLLLMHPSQVTDMRTSADSAQWFDIQRAAMTGGEIGNNPIFWNSIGMYHGVLLHEQPRITNAVSNAGAAVANTKRAVFLGAQAMMLAFGRGEGDDMKFRWMEELRDVSRQFVVAASAIWGAKKTVFSSVDFATIAIDTAGADIA